MITHNQLAINPADDETLEEADEEKRPGGGEVVHQLQYKHARLYFDLLLFAFRFNCHLCAENQASSEEY